MTEYFIIVLDSVILITYLFLSVSYSFDQSKTVSMKKYRWNLYATTGFVLSMLLQDIYYLLK